MPCDWDEAFAAIGAELKALDPKSVDLLLLRPREPRDVLSLCAVRAAVRQQQPARQLEHVPRDHVGRAQEGDRRRASALSCSRTSRTATRCSSSARTPGRTARASCIRCRRRPSAASRSSPSIRCARRAWRLHQSAEPGRDADRQGDPDQHAVSPGQGRRRHRRHHSASASMCSRPTTRQRHSGKRVLDVDFIEQHTSGFEEFEAKVRATCLGARSSAESGLEPRRDRRRRAGLCRGRARDRRSTAWA